MRTTRRTAPLLSLVCGLFTLASALAAVPAPGLKALALPGSPGRVAMDYLAVDLARSQVWVPAGNTGKVDVVDSRTFTMRSVDGFATVEKDGRALGPSSVCVGEGYAYVGNRANSEVCAVDVKTLKRAGCVTLASSPDGVACVAPTHELWVTTPHDSSLTLLDVSAPAAPKLKEVLHLEGEPEGYAVDVQHGRFFTNLEDKDATLVFDVKSHQLIARWEPKCGSVGPRGLVIDSERQILVVACTDHLVSLKADKDGQRLGTFPTGNGLDNIDYAPSAHTLFAAAGKSGNLTLVKLAANGTMTALSTTPTSPGTRVVVVDASGKAFVADSARGRLLVSQMPAPAP